MPVFPGTPGDDVIGGSSGDDVITGEGGNDVLLGGPSTETGDDTIDGGSGHDLIRGRGGADVLTGGLDDDYLQGGEGDDLIDGGAGFDRAAFVLLPTDPQVGATVDLNIAGPQDTGHGFDTLIDIEHLSGTVYDDTLIGDGGDNWLWGEGGMDTLVGNGGDDLIEVGQGDATVDGGADNDTLSFFNNNDFPLGVIVSLALQGAAQDTQGGMMTLSNFENLSGSSFNDSLQGDAGDNILLGAYGDDLLDGGDGADQLYGDGQMRPDTHNVGTSGPITLYADLDVAFGTTADGSDSLFGGDGDDLLVGGGGDDVLAGGHGFDTLDGGDGEDAASFVDMTEGVTASLAAGFSEGNVSGEFDGLSGIENLIGSAFDDFLLGDSGANAIDGEGGNDLLRGLGGDDTLDGGDDHDNLHGAAGNDSLEGGSGDDYLRGGEDDDLIDGGDGFDRAAFVTLDPGALLVGATVDLNIVGAQFTGHGFDTLTSIEHVSGTDFDDTFTGDGGDNWLWGEGGNDVLTGNGGDDMLEIGAGGTSTMSGGSGIDTAAFYDNQSFTAGVTVSLAVAGAQVVAAGTTATLSGIENLSGTQAGDSLTGDGGANLLAGAEGGDTLTGGDGDDVLLGDGQVFIDTHGTGFSGQITADAHVADFFGDPLLVGDDVLVGGKGDDFLIGGGGNDTLTGNQHRDTFLFAVGSGDDVITDFNHAQDTLAFYGYASWTLTQVGKDVLVTFDTGDTVLVLKSKVGHVAGAIEDISADPFPGGGSTDASDWFI